jgi:hypothetical protein
MRDWKGKHVFAAAIALVVGLVVGGIGPRAEVRSLQARVAELEDRGGRSRNVGRQIFGEVFRPRVEAQAPPADATAPDPVPEDPDQAEVRRPSGREDPDVDEPAAAESRAEGAQRMKDALELRRTQARAALREQAGASDDQMDEVDRIVDDMNAELQTLAQAFVDQVGEGGEPDRHDMMEFASDTLQVLLSTEDAMSQVFDPDQLDQLSQDALDPTGYVDGSVVDVLATLDRPR